MLYNTYGPFDVARRDNGSVDADQSRLWDAAENVRAGLPEGCGCYVFGIRSGGGQRPWYVGQSNRRVFRQEAFAHHKLVHFTDVVLNHERGTPVLYLVARVTTTDRLSRPSSTGHGDIYALEQLLIGQALRRNPNLCNKKDTRHLRDMVVHGLLNTPVGHPGSSAVELRGMLGIEESL